MARPSPNLGSAVMVEFLCSCERNCVNMVYLGRRFFEVHNLKDNLNRNKENVMISNFSVLATFFFVVLSGVCVFGQDKDPNAAEVLCHYRKSLSYLQSVSMKVDTKITQGANSDKPNYFETSIIFRRGHERTEWIGQVSVFDNHLNVDPNRSYIIKEIMTGSRGLSVLNSINKPPKRAMISENYDEAQKRFLDAPKYGGPLCGRIYGNSHKSVAELLSGDPNVYLRDERENINGVPCYVLEATTEHGKVTAWIAPDKGYSALKWSIHKTGDDLFNDRPISSKSWLAVFDAVELQKVGDVFVTKDGNFTLTIKGTDGTTRVASYKYETSDIQLNPDFDILGAFKIDLPDGTRVYMKEYPGIRYVWKNGQIVPADEPTFDEIDKMVEELKKEQQ